MATACKLPMEGMMDVKVTKCSILLLLLLCM